MNKKGLILILLALSWPITCIHRFWSGNASIIYWFIGNEWDYIQWYFYTLFNILSYILIFLSIWIYINSSMRKDKDILMMVGALFINQAIDLPHYLLFASGSGIITFIQGCIYLYASINVLFNQMKK